MKRIISWLLILALTTPAHAANLGSWGIDGLLTFSANTHAVDGTATDADAVPAYRVYEDETGTAILSGNMAKLDDANTTGFYSEQLTLSAANGFEKGKSYTVYISAAVDSVTGTTSHNFQIGAAVDVAYLSGDSTAADNLEDTFDESGASGVTMELEQLRVINPSGGAVLFASTGGNGGGLHCSANGTGAGIESIGGANGHGLWSVSGGAGHAIFAESTGTGIGIYAQGGATSGTGFKATATSGHGMELLGGGTGEGFSATGGTTGSGMELVGGATNMHGLVLDGDDGGDDLSLAGDDAPDLGTVVWAAATRTLSGGIGNFDDLVDGAEDFDDAAEAWAAASPTITSIPGDVWEESRASHVLSGTFGHGINSVQGSVTGSVASVTGAVGSVTAGVTVADKTGFRLSSTGIDDIWDELQAGHTTAGTFGKFVDDEVSEVSTGGLSVADIADGVWDELRAGHTTSGTFGQGVSSVQGNVTGSVASLSGVTFPTNFGSLAITAGGNVGINWANVANPTTSQTLSGTTIQGGGGVDWTDIVADHDDTVGSFGERLSRIPNAAPGLGEGIATAENVGNIEISVAEVNIDGGSISVASVHNQEPIKALTSKLGTRADGVAVAFPAQSIVPGEITQVWIDCSRRVSANLANVTNGASSSLEITVSSIGVYGKYVSVVIDATAAEDGDTATITANVTPTGSQVLKVSLDVVIDED